MTNQVKQTRIKELIEILTKASKAYYAEDKELISNLEYDTLYEELEKLENETGIVFGNSPTRKVGYEAVDNLPKMRHSQKMLSLAKTKEVEELISWIKEYEACLSWKLDGLTIVLSYQNGVLVQAVTRGNGEVGEVVTNNATVFINLPQKIPYLGELVIRGEAIISYSDFEKINEVIVEEEKYKNPRNLCSGSVRQLNNEITAKRMVRFIGFSLVNNESFSYTTRKEQLEFLSSLGFEMVEFQMVTKDNLKDTLHSFSGKIKTLDYPSDGLVLSLNDLELSKSLGVTSKFPKDSMAFKWADELGETTLLDVEWSPSRTGLINPVAIFEPVELEGSTVARASLHNISILRALELGIGDKITVYKANMIIPQINENLTRSNTLIIPEVCPACGQKTSIKQVSEAETLFCSNESCPIKKSKSFELFVSRDAMNIDGLSTATLEKFIEKGFILTYCDIFKLEQYKDEIVTMEGFGEKSFLNLIQSLENAKHTNLANFIYSLGIANVGLATAKLICDAFSYEYEAVKKATVEELNQINGVGEVIAIAFVQYMEKEENQKIMDELVKILTFEKVEKSINEAFLNKTFVITGSLEYFENRNALKELIESKGGKVSGSISKNTNYLINNDALSTSSKNKKAKELNVTIITEEEFRTNLLEK
ncbi:MAG: NAD-dependent DNA ligase LigA [Lachnospiraceae bacterium]